MTPFTHPWLSGLFGDTAAVNAWSPERQMEHYLSFEAALARALEATGRIDAGEETAQAIEAFRPNLGSLLDATARDGLPIPQLVNEIRSSARIANDAVHTGATSQDVLDTALALTLREMNEVYETRIKKLQGDLGRLSERFGTNSLMARTRMQAALPITVADRLGTWQAPLLDHKSRLAALRPRVEVLQLGGPVGTRAGWGESADALSTHMADALGIGVPARVWHTDRTSLVEYASWLSLLSGTLGKIGQDIALMAQQGIDDIVITGGGGSSAMPHKSNPIKAELLVTLARFNSAQLSAMHNSLVHEQERSGSAWMLEWMVLPMMTVATSRGLSVASELCTSIVEIGKRSA